MTVSLWRATRSRMVSMASAFLWWKLTSRILRKREGLLACKPHPQTAHQPRQSIYSDHVIFSHRRTPHLFFQTTLASLQATLDSAAKDCSSPLQCIPGDLIIPANDSVWSRWDLPCLAVIDRAGSLPTTCQSHPPFSGTIVGSTLLLTPRIYHLYLNHRPSLIPRHSAPHPKTIFMTCLGTRSVRITVTFMAPLHVRPHPLDHARPASAKIMGTKKERTCSYTSPPLRHLRTRTDDHVPSHLRRPHRTRLLCRLHLCSHLVAETCSTASTLLVKRSISQISSMSRPVRRKGLLGIVPQDRQRHRLPPRRLGAD